MAGLSDLNQHAKRVCAVGESNLKEIRNRLQVTGNRQGRHLPGLLEDRYGKICVKLELLWKRSAETKLCAKKAGWL